MASAEHKPKTLSYELPLNERIRTLLRLEYLFAQANWGLVGESAWHTRTAVATLVDILGIVGRGDLRSELVKELDRLSSNLARLESIPGVDYDRLEYFLEECKVLAQRLHDIRGPLGTHLKGEEFLNAIMQRTGIPGGTCAFDLPSYHRWLHLPYELRNEDLRAWYSGFDAIRDAGTLILRLIRESSLPTREDVPGGELFQRPLDRSVDYQLIRVTLPADSPCFAEISGSKHLFTVRFMEQPDASARPVQTEKDIRFELTCCVI